jgi:hypothetical protein
VVEPPPGWKACSTSPRRIASIARMRAAGHGRRGLVHAGERRVVTALADARLGPPNGASEKRFTVSM